MLTQAELLAMQQAIASAEAEVARLEAAAAASSAFPGLLFPTDEQRAASAARATLTAIIDVRNAAIEAGDREQAMQVTDNARRLARPGSTAAALADNTVGDVIAPALPSFRWLYVVLGVAALAAGAFFLAQLRAFIPRRT